MTYPKIETLFNRDKDTFTVIDGAFRCPEFEMIREWHVTEKIDGTNVIVTCDTTDPSDVKIQFNGRNGSSELPKPLAAEMARVVIPEKVFDVFGCSATPVTLYGEGYGAGIQKGGGAYSDVPRFRLFDVRVGEWFLNWENVEDIASTLDIPTVPVLNYAATLEEAISLVPDDSSIAGVWNGTIKEQEGIVARTNPGLLTHTGRRLMWKLKNSDYRAGKR